MATCEKCGGMEIPDADVEQHNKDKHSEESSEAPAEEPAKEPSEAPAEEPKEGGGEQ